MSAATRTLFAALAILSVPCWAATNDLKEAIRSFPYQFNYRPDDAVRCANVLIAAGEQRACEALSEAADAQPGIGGRPEGENIVLLCRLLFAPEDPARPIPRPNDCFLMPAQGAVVYERGHHFPLLITNGVPLLLPRTSSPQGALTGRGCFEEPKEYLDLCREKGVFRTQPFPIPTTASASNAVESILTSAEWQSLKWHNSTNDGTILSAEWGRQDMWRQIENMGRPRQQVRFNRIEIP